MPDPVEPSAVGQEILAEARSALAALEPDGSPAAIERAIVAAHRCLVRDGETGEAGDIHALEHCGALADRLSTLSKAGSPMVRAAVWRQLRGISGLRLYEVEGELPRLMTGVADLRAALDDLGEEDREPRRYVAGELAVALTRLGEQTSDLAPLHEALMLLDARRPFAAEDYRLANARSVAMMRIGAMAGDSTLVELAARDLQAFVRESAPTGHIADQCDRNVVAILLENARQERSERVYRDVIRIVGSRVAGELRTRSDRHYAQYLGSALLELARIEIEADPSRTGNAEKAVELLERVVRSTQGVARSQLEALHQLGQARFLLGFATGNQALVDAALQSLREALTLCQPGQHLRDGSRPRLLSDLANYTLASGRRFELDDSALEAERLFEAALGEVPMERAPGLRVQMALGLFDLRYRSERWQGAVQVAEDIDRALALVEGDPRLSAGVRLQGARLRASVTSKHVDSLCALGRILDASVVLERSRGRRIAVAVHEGDQSSPIPGAEVAGEVAAAEDLLRGALSGDDDTACRLAWEQLALARRKAGLDLGSREDALESLRGSAPAAGAFVQLHFSERRSHAFVWHIGAEEPLLVVLPANAFSAIGALFRGESGWIATYERALGADADRSGPGDGVAAWNRKIDQVQQVLGELVFAPIEESLASAGIGAGACLYLCPPGDMALLPIAAARLPGGDYAPDRWAIGIVPNARILAGAPRSGHASLCIGGWTDGRDGLPALPMAILETAALEARIAGMAPQPPGPAPPARRGAGMASASLVHIACHAAYDPDRPGRSGLELPGARLSLARLAASAFERVPTRLVYLSCCEAGMTGRTRDFDEFVGLPGGFLQLGVQGVIASLWAVDDVAAMVFALAFYDRWTPGRPEATPADALCRTQRWMRTLSWDALRASGFLPQAVLESLRLGQLRSPLRRVTEASAVTVREPGPHLPFEAPVHWAGWTLFGR